MVIALVAAALGWWLTKDSVLETAIEQFGMPEGVQKAGPVKWINADGATLAQAWVPVQFQGGRAALLEVLQRRCQALAAMIAEKEEFPDDFSLPNQICTMRGNPSVAVATYGQCSDDACTVVLVFSKSPV